jgi:cyclophilin family peptidyl-prolyl cis-trans isomerase
LRTGRRPALASAVAISLLALMSCATATDRGAGLLRHPEHPELNRRAPERFHVRLETSKGPVTVEVQRGWAPLGADRFYNLVRYGFFDDARFFRVIAGRWAQFGIHGDPEVAALWRARTVADDPVRASNTRGTLAFAFAVSGGRSTQVFINLRDNSGALDAQGFAPFGRVIAGMEAVDALNAEYGESAGGGIRAGRQDPLFAGGNAYLRREFPRLDFIRRARVVEP